MDINTDEYQKGSAWLEAGDEYERIQATSQNEGRLKSQYDEYWKKNRHEIGNQYGWFSFARRTDTYDCWESTQTSIEEQINTNECWWPIQTSIGKRLTQISVPILTSIEKVLTQTSVGDQYKQVSEKGLTQMSVGDQYKRVSKKGFNTNEYRKPI